MRVASVLMVLVTSSVGLGQTTVPLESLNRTIQNRLNTPTQYTDNFQIKPVRALSDDEDAERRYQEALLAQRDAAILAAKNFLKQNASYKRSRNESDRKSYQRMRERLEYCQSPSFVPLLEGTNEGAIGKMFRVKILQALPNNMIRATVGDDHEVFVRGIQTTSDSDCAWMELGDSVVVVEVVGQLSYETVLGQERSLKLLEVVDVSAFHERAAEAEQRSTRKERTVERTHYEVREWTDTTGRFSVDAAFAGLSSDTVTLRKEDGDVIKVPIERLSRADREYIESLRK
ncbi:MAG TPA: SHD1 domain-containing protein [Pirellulaceae bacterium]|nr:SHD1 domain-containing protein [Pirellulaceae bacterium]